MARQGRQLKGWVRIPRKTVAQVLSMKPPSVHSVYFWCLAFANHTPGKKPAWIPGEDEARFLEKGELVTSETEIAKATGLSEKTVRRALKALQRLPWFTSRSVRGNFGRSGVFVKLKLNNDCETEDRQPEHARPEALAPRTGTDSRYQENVNQKNKYQEALTRRLDASKRRDAMNRTRPAPL